ncbi:MAG: tetratricopeptide repeat protein [Candidatus Marinimicrobia bacterium]|nr:tetratricopeptide repeat protein [Candidatus Neomarinimicrobiota bacterium]
MNNSIKISLSLISLLFLSCASGVLKEVNLLYDSGEYKAAVKSLNTIIENTPENADAHLLLGKTLQAQGKSSSAFEEFKIANKLAPNNKDAASALQRYYADDGKQKLAAGKIEEAISLYDRAHKLDESDSESSLGLANALIKFGLLTKAEGLLDKVSGLKEEVNKSRTQIEKQKKIASTAFTKGKKAYDKGQYSSAKKHMDKAIMNNRDDNDIKYYSYMSNGLFLYKKGSRWQIWDAIVEFGKAAAVNPLSAEANYYQALGYLKKDDKDFDNILSFYEKALELDVDGKFSSEIKKGLKKQRQRKKVLDEFWGK